MEKEMAEMEQELARIKSMAAASQIASSTRGGGGGVCPDRSGGEPQQQAAPRWRSAVELPPSETEECGPPKLLPRNDSLTDASFDRRWSAAAETELKDDPWDVADADVPGDTEDCPPSAPPPKRDIVEEIGKWHGIQSFLDNIGLGAQDYAELLVGRGLDNPEALMALDPVQMRRLGITNRHAMKLRMGIAELRALAAGVTGNFSAPGGAAPLPPSANEPARPASQVVCLEPNVVASSGGQRSAAPSSRQKPPGLRRQPSAGVAGRPPSLRRPGQEAQARCRTPSPCPKDLAINCCRESSEGARNVRPSAERRGKGPAGAVPTVKRRAMQCKLPAPPPAVIW